MTVSVLAFIGCVVGALVAGVLIGVGGIMLMFFQALREVEP